MKKDMFKILGLSVATLFMANVAFAVNDIDIEQVGDNNNSVTFQNGAGNDMDIQQGDTGSNDIDASQVGDSNTAFIDQDGHNNGAALDNEVDLVQTGDNNIVRVDQDAQGTGTDTGTNKADVTQTGNGNILRGASVAANVAIAGTGTSSATQNSLKGSNNLTSKQTGNDNKAGLQQNTDGNNTANIIQSGADEMFSFQESTFGAATNDLNVDQLGAVTNVASNYQTGASSHDFTLCQKDAAATVCN